VRRDLLEQLQKLCADRCLEQQERRDVAAGPRVALHEACLDRIAGLDCHDRDGTSLLLHRHDHEVRAGENDVRRAGRKLRREGARAVRIAGAPANVEPKITALRPSESLQRRAERREAGLPLPIALREAHEDADAAYAGALLRARHERPEQRRSGRRAGEQRDELAPPCMSRKEHCEG
jgi:hypothetical protein